VGRRVTALPLFVYGSLRRGGTHHAELRGAEFLGAASTAPKYALTALGEYPALVPGAESIPGELYAASPSLLAELDAFEGEAYLRTPILLSNGARALAYLLAPGEDGETPWPST